MKIVPLNEVKNRFSTYLELSKREDIVVTKNGRPAAVIMSFDEWESWRETFDILSDKRTMKRIRRSVAYFNEGGKGKTIDEVFGKDS